MRHHTMRTLIAVAMCAVCLPARAGVRQTVREFGDRYFAYRAAKPVQILAD